MNREIKFRAWDINHEEMCNVRMLNTKDAMVGIYCKDRSTIYMDGTQPMSYKLTKMQNIELMQFTGLKDKNGKEIFEGDIILLKHETGYNTWYENKEVIIFESGSFSCCIYSELDGSCDCEVIGNIYENPDL